MNYEKAYKEALGWMRSVYPTLQGAAKEDAEHYFPELRESENERMVREFNDWLCEEIECRTNDLRDEKDLRTLNMLCYVLTKVKAWLEKQKVNTEGDFGRGYDCGYQAGYAVAMNEMKPKVATATLDSEKQKEQTFTHHEVDESLVKAVTHQMEDDGDIDDFVRKGLDDVVLKYAELGAKWQKEQKPVQSAEEKEFIRTIKSIIADFIRDKKPEYVGYYQRIYDWLDGRHIEQKPVECVTDAEMKKGLDELTKFKCFASALSDMYNIIPSHSSLRPKDIDWNNFCAGLLTYLKRDQPVEWSEEDENMRYFVTEAVQSRYSDRELAKYLDLKIINEKKLLKQKLFDWLRDLRPSWKPSEEQMKYLCEAVDAAIRRHNESVNGYAPAMVLKSLYEQLRQL